MNNENMENLCRCNNCMRLLIDHNPQAGAAKFKVPDNLPEVQRDVDGVWKCPECITDGYLSDVGLAININLSSEEDVYHIISKLIKWCDKGITDAQKVNDKKANKMFVHFKKQIFNELSAK